MSPPSKETGEEISESEVWAQSYRTAGIKAGEGNGGELSPEASGKAQRGGRPLTCVPPQWEESQHTFLRNVQPLPNTDPFPVPRVLPFQECHIKRFTPYVTFESGFFHSA